MTTYGDDLFKARLEVSEDLVASGVQVTTNLRVPVSAAGPGGVPGTTTPGNPGDLRFVPAAGTPAPSFRIYLCTAGNGGDTGNTWVAHEIGGAGGGGSPA